MDYKEKYEEAFRMARDVYYDSSADSNVKEHLSRIFPELEESSDKRIMKAIYNYIDKKEYSSEPYSESGNTVRTYLDWLKKQIDNNGKWINEDVYWADRKELYETGKEEVIENPKKYGLEKKKEPAKVNEDFIRVHIDETGQKWVRVKVFDEDFLIAGRDYSEGFKDDYTWEEACKIGTFSEKQAHIVCAYRDRINASLIEIGGKELDGNYWTATEDTNTVARFVNFSYGRVSGSNKASTLCCRAVLDLKPFKNER